MKQFLLATAICLLATVTVKAQFLTDLIVHNATSCPIYFEVWGVSSTATCPTPTITTTSNLVVQGPGRIDYDNSTTLPGAFMSGELFYWVTVYAYDPNHPNHCGVPIATFDMDVCTGPVIWMNQDLSENDPTSCLCTSNNVTVHWQQSATTGILKIY